MAGKKSKVASDAAGPTGFVFFLAWVGALFYFIGQVDGLWNIIIAFLKACVWPAILIYEVFTRMGI
jgi:hypothetical protein